MECKVDLARAMPGEDEDPMITLVVDIYVRTPSDVLVKFVKFGSSIFRYSQDIWLPKATIK